MKGGTLLASRAVKNHAYYKTRLETLGFSNVTVTALDKDALNTLIYEMKPEILMMGARYYQCCTPYMMKQLKSNFPKLKMAALSIGHYPPELAMYFILNGINSYVTSFDGIDQWYMGLEEIRKGKNYISPEVVERIDLRREYPEPARNITERQKQVIILVCNGFKDDEIGELLNISIRTVTTLKTQIFTTLNVRNANELIRMAIFLQIVTQDGLFFYPTDFTLNPLPINNTKTRKRRKEL